MCFTAVPQASFAAIHGDHFYKIFRESLLKEQVVREKIRYISQVEPERKHNVITTPQRA